MKKKVLILSPHADDEILGCGGFISKYSKQNYHINVLVLTNANKGAPEIFTTAEIKKLRNESKVANNFIGTKRLFFENLGICLNDHSQFYQKKLLRILSLYYSFKIKFILRL